MPCIYEPSSDEIRQPDKDKIDSLTRMLCTVLNALHNRFGDALEMLDEVPLEEAKEIQNWWSEHQERDRKRRQELKQKALAKLTKEEQEALGFFDINGV